MNYLITIRCGLFIASFALTLSTIIINELIRKKVGEQDVCKITEVAAEHLRHFVTGIYYLVLLTI